ncbi:MAG: PCRF domain-containing protein [Phycisphaerales bacterium]|nr:PCRF domain-containing protein [Phycisphaerales bacterium]
MTGPDALSEAIMARLDAMDAEYEAIERALADPGTAGDHRAARDLSIRRAALAPTVEAYRRWRTLRVEVDDLRRAIEADDAELAALAQEELPLVEGEAAALADRVKTLLVGAEDRRVGSVMLEIRAGTGGDEAGLWARDLLSVYERHAQRRGWVFEPLDVVADPSVGGVRSAVVNIRGEGVWSDLSFEAGVHSVKRVPATESQGRIHTSTATVAVLPEPEEVEVRIDWARDVQEHVTTAQGPGGQNVNKVATAVHLVHIPTGVEVRMQESKSQHQNRERARRLLAARVHEIERRRVEAERSAERRGQIGAGERSEKIRVYRFQDNIVADQRLDQKFNLREVLAGDLDPLFAALQERRTAERLASF